VEKRLESFKPIVHSKNGEDGLILEILSRLGLTVNREFWCVELSAGAGIHLSNTFALVEPDSACALRIEGGA
jgi:hypothetical protein